MTTEKVVAVRKITSNGRIQIPSEIRRELGLTDGDSVLWIRSVDGKFYIKPQKFIHRFVVEGREE